MAHGMQTRQRTHRASSGGSRRKKGGDEQTVTDEGGAVIEDRRVPKKKRKATYLVRKEQAQSLRETVAALRSELAMLKGRDGGLDARLQGSLKLKESVSENTVLRNVLYGQSQAVASAQSMLSECAESQSYNPMHTYIHLPKAWTGRHKILLALQDDMFMRAYQYTTAHSKHLKSLKPHLSEERYENDSGDFCCTRFEVIHFPGVSSLKQVFDALVFSLFNMEISISEQLGQITVREDYHSETSGSCISNHRLVSGNDNGVTTEFNAVAFGKYFDNRPEFSDRPCAILTTDSVDQDDLHPYNPLQRVRKDITASMLLTEERRSKRTGRIKRQSEDEDDDDEFVVVMQRVAFLKTYRPGFRVASNALDELREGITDWADVMLRMIRELVYVQAS